MAKLYNITLTSTSPPTTGYTIYYNSVNVATIATIGLAGGPATNLTKTQLVSPGLKVSVPDTATSVIMYNIECASSANFIVPISVTITASASNINSTSLTLDWITSPSGIATSYLIFKDGILLETLGNVSTYNVSDLTAEVTYNFSVQGKDISGNVVGISNSVIVTTPSGIISFCAVWDSYYFTPEVYIQGYLDFLGSMLPGETIVSSGTNVDLISYVSINGYTYNGLFGAPLSFTDGTTIGTFGTYTNPQSIEGDDSPVYSLRFSGTVQTDYPRTLTVDVTSVYDTYTPGISPTSSANNCP